MSNTSFFFRSLITIFFSYWAQIDTQLQWTFQSVARTKDHPMGVKSTYRRYVQEKVCVY